MWAGIAGGILGAVTSLYSAYEQRKQNKIQNRLAQQQYEASKQAFENEQQERAKAEQKEADAEALLDASTEKGEETNLTLLDRKKQKRNMFNRKATALGSLGDYDG